MVAEMSLGDLRVARGIFPVLWRPTKTALTTTKRLAAQDPSNTQWQRDLIISNVKLAEIAEARRGQAPEAKLRYRAALEVLDGGRLAPVDAWMIDELEARLARFNARAAGP
jgi:hypothetical protein